MLTEPSKSLESGLFLTYQWIEAQVRAALKGKGYGLA